jgi:hypothetical protein
LARFLRIAICVVAVCTFGGRAASQELIQTAGAPREAKSSEEGTSSLICEAESGTIVLPMIWGWDSSASGDFYVSTPRGQGWDRGHVTLRVHVESSGRYNVRARVYAPDWNSDSFWVSVDGETEQLYGMGGTRGNWFWDTVTYQCDDSAGCPWEIALSAGDHDIRFRTHETGGRLDCIEIVSAGNAPESNRVTLPLVIHGCSTLGGGREQISFDSFRSGSEIRLISSDGTSEAPLFDAGEFLHEQYASWRSDGKKVVFTASRSGESGIFVADADGTNAVRISDAYPAYGPVWSPDGTKIAFESKHDGNQEIYVMNADGTGMVRLTNHPDQDFDPDWSPDGSKIAFVSSREGGWEIYTMKPDGSEKTRLTSDSYADKSPDWSPDGTKIAFSSDRDGDRDIYVMNSDGSAVTRVAAKEGIDHAPDWSPNGRKIAFVSGLSTSVDAVLRYSVWVMTAEGTCQSRLTSDDTSEHNPAWIP